MRKSLLTLVLAAFALCGWAADNNKLHVSTDLFQFGDSILVLLNDQEKVFTGKNGKFEFDLEVSKVGELILTEPRVMWDGDLEDLKYFKVPAVPGETMRLWNTDNSRYDVSGTGFYAEFHKHDLALEEVAKDYTAGMMKVMEMNADESIDPQDVMSYYQNTVMPLEVASQKKILDYIKAHANEETIVPFISQLGTLEQVKEAVAALSPDVRDGRMKPYYEEIVSTMERQAMQAEEEAKAAEKQAAGLLAPDFTLNDLNGKPLALSSLRGKYVVLDFWGSWCIWCIKGFPQMKEYYAKYPGKFEILGIDCNDSEKKWKDAVQTHQLPWLHVYNPKNSNVLADYGIQGFPTKIIIDPEGKIVKTIVGEDPEFYTILDSLFGK